MQHVWQHVWQLYAGQIEASATPTSRVARLIGRVQLRGPALQAQLTHAACKLHLASQADK